MRILTDFAQWYDGIFDAEGPTFHRMAFTRGGLPKREQLALFERLGLSTPPHGRVRELAAIEAPFGGSARWRREVSCVVYEDELAHQGQGKRLVSLAEALDSHPDAYASLYFPPRSGAGGVNLRHARVGRVGAWIRQVSRDDWRSNQHDEEEVLERTTHREPSPIPRVLWAIDFLPTPSGLLAIDLNTAPDLDSLGESGLLTADEIRVELERASAETPTWLAQL